MNNNRVLIIAAHPDDEVLGCGGTIKKMTLRNDEVYIAILGKGIASRFPAGSTELNQEKDLNLATSDLINNSRKSASLLGVSDIIFYDLPDNSFDSVPLLHVVKIIESLVEDFKPHKIYTHHHSDLNIDHVIVNRAVLTATRPMINQSVKKILAFEVPSSTEWSFQSFNTTFNPNVFINISDTLKTKIDAMSYYKSEIQPFPHPRSLVALEIIAKRWGSVVGCYAAEAFQLIRSIE